METRSVLGFDLELEAGACPLWETTGMSGDLARDGKEGKGQLGLGPEDNGKSLQIMEQGSEPLSFNSLSGQSHSPRLFSTCCL